ncbi:MAG: hypothetical protein IKL82_04070 [Clostridia bacterium]|nr:hypothetical protein [Clostridia bacterium]
MKKKLLSIILSIFMLIPCTLALSACGKTTTISKDRWEQTFKNDTFRFQTDALTLKVTENTFGYNNEFVRLTENNETKYYSYTLSNSSNSFGTLTPIEESAFVYGREYFAPLLNFISDNYKQFKYEKNSIGGNTYHAKLQVPANVKAIISEHGNVDKDEYLFVVQIMSMSGNDFEETGIVVDYVKILDKDYESYNINDRGIIEFRNFGKVYSTYFMEKSLYDIKNLNVDFKVVGGTGTYYTELYFTKNAVRFCTPNVGAESEYVEGIYCLDEGVYTYYKKNKAGQWSSEPVDETIFNTVYTSYFNMFGGKPLIDQNNMRLFRNEVRFSSNEALFGGQSSLQKTYYNNYSLKYDDGIIGGKWNVEIRQDFGDLSVDTGTYIMTVCDVEIDIPTV